MESSESVPSIQIRTSPFCDITKALKEGALSVACGVLKKLGLVAGVERSVAHRQEHQVLTPPTPRHLTDTTYLLLASVISATVIDECLPNAQCCSERECGL